MQMALIQQHRTQDRLLGLQVVGRDGDVLDAAHGQTEYRFGSGVCDTFVPA
jgi:hypothetical protein